MSSSLPVRGARTHYFFTKQFLETYILESVFCQVMFTFKVLESGGEGQMALLLDQISIKPDPATRPRHMAPATIGKGGAASVTAAIAE
jgi:hypothetical protein